MVDRAKKITELTAVTSITNNDVFIVVTNTAGTATTKKITINNFRAGLPPITVGVANTTSLGTVIVANNLTVNATGHLSLSSNVTVNNTLSVTGETYLTGNVYLGVSAADNASELIHFYGTIFSNVIPHTANNYQIGNTANYWSAVHTRIVKFSTDGTIQRTAFQVTNTVPTTASSNGTVGEFAFDTNYIYYCVANNTWKRVALSTWP